MDILTLSATVLRRWYIAVPVLLLTVVAVLAVNSRIEQQYELKGVFLAGNERLASPGIADEGADEEAAEEDGEAGVEIAPGISSVIIADSLRSGEVLERLQANGASSTFDVTAKDNLLRVKATDIMREPVVPTVAAVLGAIEDEVTRRQEAAGVPEEERLVVEVLAMPTDASIQTEREDGGEVFTAFGSIRLVEPLEQDLANPYKKWGFSLPVLEELVDSKAGRTRIAELADLPAAPPKGENPTSAPVMSFGISGKDDDQGGAPLAKVSATGTDPAAVQRAFDGVVEYASEELSTRQATLGIPPEAQLQLLPLSVPAEPSPIGREATRTLLTIAGLGIVAALGLALLFENAMQGLARRRARASLDDAADHLTVSLPEAHSGYWTFGTHGQPVPGNGHAREHESVRP